jgi:hypothetical protein
MIESLKAKWNALGVKKQIAIVGTIVVILVIIIK